MWIYIYIYKSCFILSDWCRLSSCFVDVGIGLYSCDGCQGLDQEDRKNGDAKSLVEYIVKKSKSLTFYLIPKVSK